MSNGQLREGIYEQIVRAYEVNGSVQTTARELGVSRMTVQRVLITEGIWESERSREIVRLAVEGKTATEIADELYLSLKCVQNYMPYTRGMNQERVTANSKIAIQKRERMRIALEAQRHKITGISKSNTTTVNEGILNKGRIDFENMKLDLGEIVKKEDRPDISAKRYAPAVFKLKFELVDYNGEAIEFSEEEQSILNKYGKMKCGFIREALVSSEMSLNALNYMIQKLYGWQNSHLHNFLLPEKTFNSVTDNGSIEPWKRLCGVLFRFPDDDYTDKYCADDYDGTKSFKTWIKNKYSGSELPFSVGDTYIDNQMKVDEFESACQNNRARFNTLDELIMAIDLEGDGEDLLERLSLGELLHPVYENISIEEWLEKLELEIQDKQKLIEQSKKLSSSYLELIDSLGELRQRRISQAEMESVIRAGVKVTDIPKTPAEQFYVDNKKEIDYLSSNCRRILSAFEPKISPLTDTLLYRYDYGDGWCVKITCAEGYYINDYMDFPNEQGWIAIIADDKKAIQDWDFYSSSDDKKILGEYAEQLRGVANKKAPKCIYSDGAYLLDDVGGIGGFIDMLKTIHGDDLEAAEEMREWAKGQGWFGRSVKIENML